MINSQKILNLLGVAKKAGKVLVGYDTVVKSFSNLDKSKISLVFVANDASDNTKEKFKNKCLYYNILLDFSFDHIALSKCLGKDNVNVLAICDDGFSNSIKKLLKEGVNYEG